MKKKYIDIIMHILLWPSVAAVLFMAYTMITDDPWYCLWCWFSTLVMHDVNEIITNYVNKKRRKKLLDNFINDNTIHS